jgi:restriction system protein
MAIWLIRAGRHGEYEQKFMQENRVYVTWDDLNESLAKLKNRAELTALITKLYPDRKPNTVRNWTGQVWPFVHEMSVGDLVVVPLKAQPAIQIGEIIGDYQFEPAGPSPYFHWRAVKWIGEAVPRSHFGKDLLFSIGAAMTICRIKRHNAEARFAAMRANGWKSESITFKPKPPVHTSTDEETENTDLEELARDQIAQLISARFKGHGLTRLVEAI